MHDAAKRLGVTPQHLRLVLKGLRKSRSLAGRYFALKSQQSKNHKALLELLSLDDTATANKILKAVSTLLSANTELLARFDSIKTKRKNKTNSTT